MFFWHIINAIEIPYISHPNPPLIMADLSSLFADFSYKKKPAGFVFNQISLLFSHIATFSDYIGGIPYNSYRMGIL